MSPAWHILLGTRRCVNELSRPIGHDRCMRRCLALLLVVSATLLPGCARGTGDAQCRAEFGDFAQSLAENGNPGSTATPITTRRWDELADQFSVKARTAVGEDCDDELPHLRRTMRGTQTILFAVQDYDLGARLAHAEADLQHAKQANTYERLPRRLTSAFAELREAAPRAERSLSPQVTALDRVDPLDRQAISSATTALSAAARSDPDHRRCLRLLDVIDGYTLDEE
jgi:hypothetical protein